MPIKDTFNVYGESIHNFNVMEFNNSDDLFGVENIEGKGKHYRIIKQNSHGDVLPTQKDEFKDFPKKFNVKIDQKGYCYFNTKQEAEKILPSLKTLYKLTK
jgi:hypothetical protein